jgi:hypothetical protein
MNTLPCLRYRPIKTPDGEGGFVVTLGAPVTINGAIVIFKNQPTMIVRREADVRIDDLVVVDSVDI